MATCASCGATSNEWMMWQHAPTILYCPACWQHQGNTYITATDLDMCSGCGRAQQPNLEKFRWWENNPSVKYCPSCWSNYGSSGSSAPVRVRPVQHVQLVQPVVQQRVQPVVQQRVQPVVQQRVQPVVQQRVRTPEQQHVQTVQSGDQALIPVYKMDLQYRGWAVLFYNPTHTDQNLGERSQKDVVMMARAMRGSGFTVKIYQDLTAASIQSTLQSYSTADHSSRDCFMVAFLSHGTEDRFGRTIIATRDGYINFEDAKQTFFGRKCPSLAGKPKIFFHLACRGGGDGAAVDVLYKAALNLKKDVEDQPVPPPPAPKYPLAENSNFLSVYETQRGLHSFEGMYMPLFCKFFEKHRDTSSLQDILLCVHKTLSEMKVPSYHPTVMQPAGYDSSLTGKVFLKSKAGGSVEAPTNLRQLI